jgi:hypothetical protein
VSTPGFTTRILSDAVPDIIIKAQNTIYGNADNAPFYLEILISNRNIII